MGRGETLIFNKEFVGNTELLRFQGTDGKSLFPSREMILLQAAQKTIDNSLDRSIIASIRLGPMLIVSRRM